MAEITKRKSLLAFLMLDLGLRRNPNIWALQRKIGGPPLVLAVLIGCIKQDPLVLSNAKPKRLQPVCIEPH